MTANDPHPPQHSLVTGLLVGLVSLALIGCSGPDEETVRVAFVTNNASNFWKIAKQGCDKAAQDFDCRVEFRIPAGGTAAEQQTIIEDLLVKGIDGIAISPKDPVNQVEILNRAAVQTNLICHDSDSPDSDRICYVGTNNIVAGEAAGKLIQEVLPDGGKIMLFVGTLDDVQRVLRVRGFVNSSPEFTDQPKVVNGASELLLELFGDDGKHARTAVGVAALPGNVAVEIDMLIRIKGKG